MNKETPRVVACVYPSHVSFRVSLFALIWFLLLGFQLHLLFDLALELQEHVRRHLRENIRAEYCQRLKQKHNQRDTEAKL